MPLDVDVARLLPVTFTLADGSNITATYGDLDLFNIYNVQICTIYSAQLGASLILLVVMALLSKAERRKTWMFSLCAMALLLNTLRMLFLIFYFTGMWSEAYVYWAGDYDLVPSADYGLSIAAVLFTLLTLICVEACLVLQTQVVLITLPRLYRRAILAISGLIAVSVVGLRIAYSVYNINAILYALPDSDFDSLSEHMNILTTVSICWFSCIFTIKLAHAILQRRKMGLQQFGPMDVLCIMGGQTMIIPAILSVIWHATMLPSLSSTILTAAAIFLPLSSLWATSIIDNRRAAAHATNNNNNNNAHGSPGDASATFGGTTFRTASTSTSRVPLKLKAAVMGLARPFTSRGGGDGSRNGSDSQSTATFLSQSQSQIDKEARVKDMLVDLEKQGIKASWP